MKEIRRTGRTLAAEQAGQWGLLTQDGEWIVDPKFANIGIPGRDHFPARLSEKSDWSLFTLSGEEFRALPRGVVDVGFPSQQLRSFKTLNGWGFFDENGAQVIEPRFRLAPGYRRGSRLSEYISGQAAVMIEAGSSQGIYGSLWLGLIDCNGSWIVDPAPHFQAFGDNSLLIYPINGPMDEPPWGIDVRPLGRNKGPELRVPFSTADDLAAFRNGFAPFGVDRSIGPERNSEAYLPSTPIEPRLLNWGLMDEKGRVIIPAAYEVIRPPSEGLVPFRESGRWGFLKLTGEVCISPRFLEVEHFANNAAVCQSQEGRWGIIAALYLFRRLAALERYPLEAKRLFTPLLHLPIGIFSA